uniref:Immunoglobulin subtype domain-containing protein n=1 Tax=Gopherus evgoodei TaxID=1825980 RepID=A0A8C4YJC2_9SAUR
GVGVYKASLRVNPAGGMVPAGGRVSLRCLCQVPCARLFLHRDTGPIPVQHAEAWGQAAEFPINRAGPGDTGTYHCRYLSRYGQPRWSESSDPVRLVVGGESPMCGPLTQSSDAATSGFGWVFPVQLFLKSEAKVNREKQPRTPHTHTGVWPGRRGSCPSMWGDMPRDRYRPGAGRARGWHPR